jgi:hypothetical protein
MSTALFSDPGPRGTERASEALLNAMRRRREMFQGADADAYLRAMKANGSCATPTDMVLFTDARTIEAWEEFLHGTQLRLRLEEKYGLAELEVTVKGFMIRHRRLLGLIDEDVAWLHAALEMIR